MSLGKVKAITDICILVEDVEKTIAFYTEKLGFDVRRKAEGFVDFHGPGVTLAAWEIDHISENTGVSGARAPKGVNKACIAVELESPQLLDDIYEQLRERGVQFKSPPDNYSWNARCVYFLDPDDMLWELYAWNEGGADAYHDVTKRNS